MFTNVEGKFQFSSLNLPQYDYDNRYQYTLLLCVYPLLENTLFPLILMSQMLTHFADLRAGYGCKYRGDQQIEKMPHPHRQRYQLVRYRDSGV